MMPERRVGAFLIAIAVTFASGCVGGAVPPIGPAEPFVQTASVRTANAVPNGNVPRVLVYIGDSGTNRTDVVTYPSFAPYQTIQALSPGCVDSAGDVWFIDGAQLIEYAHGGTVPLRMLGDPLAYPGACAVSPSDGTLAVSGILSSGGGPGEIALFAHAKGKPKIITAAPKTYFITFDSHDDLFGDGESSGGTAILFELPKGASAVRSIALVGATVEFPGNVQYTGNVLNVGDQEAATNYETHVKGTTATVTGSTPLDGSSDCVHTFIYSDRLFCPDAGNADVEVYAYPKGGSPVKVLSGFSEPVGLVVSAAAR